MALCVAGIFAATLFRERPDGSVFLQGMQALDEGRMEDAEEAIDRLTGDPEFEREASLLRAARLTRNQEFEAALQELGADTPRGALSVPTDLIAGECYYRLRRLTEAEQRFKNILQQDSQHLAARRMLSAIYYDLGAMELALAELKTIGELAPTDYRPHRLAGLIRHDFEQYKEAEEPFRRALALKPPGEIEADIRWELADSLTLLHRYEEALLILEGQTSARSLALRAQCQWSLGLRPAADEALSMARVSDSTDRVVLRVSASILLEQSKPAEAIPVLEQLLAADPHDFRSRYQLANALGQLGQTERQKAEMTRTDEARKRFLHFSDLNSQAIGEPRNKAVRRELVKLCQEMGRTELAEMWQVAADAIPAESAPAP